VTGYGLTIRRRCLLSMLLAVGAVASQASPAVGACPNESARTGASAVLPDCRAYELVSPPDANGRILGMISNFALGSAPQITDVELSTPFGTSFVYEVYASSLQQPAGGTGIMDVYEADREADGWETRHRLSQPANSLAAESVMGPLSPDHTYSFSSQAEVEYLRDPQGAFELAAQGSLADEPSAQGRFISVGGTHVIFTTGNQIGQSVWCTVGHPCPVHQLEPNAPPTGTGAVYDRSADGPTHVISLLPGDAVPNAGEQAFYKGSSQSGTAVAFSIGNKLFIRVDDAKTEEMPLSGAVYAGFSTDGTYLFYVGGDSIYRFNTITETEVAINPSGHGEIVNISADGSHVYFISEQQLDGSKGTFGQPNLYVWSGGSPQYIATVAASDLVQTNDTGTKTGMPALTNWTGWVANPPPTGSRQGPGADSSRTSPDGTVLIFESRAKLTDYDNAGHTEIYRYAEADKSLICASCSHTAAPTEDARLQELDLVDAPIAINNLSADGKRVFFETPEPLVSADTNGINDIYEWEEEGAGQSVALVSSGKSPEYPLPVGQETAFNPRPNPLLSITPSGSDVFFTAKEALVPGAGEGGAQAIYDARVGGGFIRPPVAEACLEEQCRGLSGVGQASSMGASSEAIAGRGNVKPRRHRPHCHPARRASAKKGKPRGCKHRREKNARSSSISTGEDGSPGVSEPLSKQASGEPGGPAAGEPIGSAASEGGFGIDLFDADLVEADASPAKAGSHSDLDLVFELAHFKDKDTGQETTTANADTISFSLPPGLLGNPQAVPSCSTGDLVSFGNCSSDAQVGITRVKVGDPLYTSAVEPIYNLTPPHPGDEVARFGFIADLFPVFIDIKVRSASDYGVTATVHGAPGLGSLLRAKSVLWGNPSASSHDKERLTPLEAVNCAGGVPCKSDEEKRASTIPPQQRKGFITNPSACQEGSVDLTISTYQLPGQVFEKTASLPPITDCTGLPFAPTFEAEPTSHEAGAPTGLRTKLLIPQHLGEGERATSTMREARVTLPAGMQVAAGAANWIGTCSDEEVGYHKEVDTNCPDSSKLGTAKIISPALSVPIEGTIYQRSPQPGRQLGLWLTADALGLHVKLPGELEPDKTTGRLTAVFKDLPQVPVEEIDLSVWGGPRAPLQNPDHCGDFTTDFTFAPHSDDPAATGQSTMQITEGCSRPFAPTLHAGVTEPTAGKYSPFVFDLTRPDGDQALRGFELQLPEGAIGKPKGVPLCTDQAAATGTCPAESRIGSLKATTGPGPDPLQVPQAGKAEPAIYFAGPYQGAPFSIVSEVPAQAGPFDLGVLAVRSALRIDPETARATVVADPLPQFFEGIGIAYRNLHAVVDRPEFFLNPTDCREMAVTADATSTQGTKAHPTARFQVDGCKALKFKPKLSLKLKGGTKRASYPALTAVLKARKGDANIASASVALPHSEFLAQEHIGTICTRVQFAADKCPKGSVYGRAKAITPLLDTPLSGPVYLRSSNHPLPDLVAKLGGQVEIDLVGRIDSIHGGIRATFESIPDAPVTKFVLQMRGGAKGVFTNSTDICRGSHRATAVMKAQNGRAVTLRPALVSSGCGKKNH
jgi:hypothetical protein